MVPQLRSNLKAIGDFDFGFKVLSLSRFRSSTAITICTGEESEHHRLLRESRNGMCNKTTFKHIRHCLQICQSLQI
ncbi:hypothetical protein ACSBR2_037892 [Camellia fascicularis]